MLAIREVPLSTCSQSSRCQYVLNFSPARYVLCELILGPRFSIAGSHPHLPIRDSGPAVSDLRVMEPIGARGLLRAACILWYSDARDTTMRSEPKNLAGWQLAGQRAIDEPWAS